MKKVVNHFDGDARFKPPLKNIFLGRVDIFIGEACISFLLYPLSADLSFSRTDS
jgi:hypothetical protein